MEVNGQLHAVAALPPGKIPGLITRRSGLLIRTGRFWRRESHLPLPRNIYNTVTAKRRHVRLTLPSITSCGEHKINVRPLPPVELVDHTRNSSTSPLFRVWFYNSSLIGHILTSIGKTELSPWAICFIPAVPNFASSYSLNTAINLYRRSRWPRGLRSGYPPAHFFRLRVRILRGQGSLSLLLLWFVR